MPPPAESTDDSDGSTSIASASGGSGQQWLRKKNTEPVAEEDTAPIPEIAEAPAVVTPAVVAEHSVAPAVVLAPAPSTAQSMAQTSAPVAATAYDSEEFEALSASASHANLGVEELEQPPVAEQGPPSIAADLVVLAPEAPMDTSNILDNEPSLDLSFRTDDDKRDFFARVESVANDGAIDYAALNRALPDDSVDVGGMSMRDVIGAAPDAAIHSSFPAFGEPSAAPAAVTEAIAPTSSTSDHSSKGSSRLDLDEEHTEDLASIQSNIDFIERSHVFQESGEDGTSSMAEVSIRESPKKQKPPARPSPPSSRASVSARSSALDRLNKKIATSAGARTKTAPKSNSNSSSATTSLVDLSMASAASVQEYDQRNREANFLQQLLDQEQSKGQALKSQVESLTATVARLTADNTVLIAETEDFRKLLSDRDATIKHAREKESAASDGKSATRATNDYQEQLLRGFQQENDKLVAEIAEWKKRVAEAKAEAARDHQQLHDEILELRTALKEKPGRESVMSRHRDDEYESRLEALTKQHRDAELELKITVDEWRVRYETAMREPLAQARLKAEQEVNAMKAQLDGEVRRLRQELAAFKEREEARATEPDHAAEAEALRHTVDSLRAELEAERGAHANALHDKELALIQAGQTADDAVSKLKRETLALVELRKTVAEYKQRIVDMEKRLEKERPNPIADLIRATKPSAEEQLLVDELRAKVATLEGDNQALHDDMTRRLRSLRAEHDAMVQDYERRVQALQATVAQAEEQRDAAERQKTSGAAPVRDLPLPMTVSSTSSHNNETNAILREVIQSLRDELRQRANDEMKLRREADDYRLKYANSHAELQQQSALARQLESNLRQLRENLDAVNRKLSESGRAKAGGDAAANEQVVKLLQEEINVGGVGVKRSVASLVLIHTN